MAFLVAASFLILSNGVCVVSLSGNVGLFDKGKRGCHRWCHPGVHVMYLSVIGFLGPPACYSPSYSPSSPPSPVPHTDTGSCRTCLHVAWQWTDYLSSAW